MPYGCEVLARDGARVTLRVIPEQPDCEPFYVRADFAIGLLWGMDGGALAAALGDWPFDAIADGAVDASPYVRAVEATIEQRGDIASGRPPIARYVVDAADARWVTHLEPGVSFDCYAWCGGGPVLEDVFETPTRLPVGTYAPGDRVAIHAGLAVSPGALDGRGVVEASATCRWPRPGWTGGTTVLRVALDHGPRVWAFAETLRRAPSDTYERAHAAPLPFIDDLLARAPLERARALHFLALRSGGDSLVPADAERPYDVAIAGAAPWLYGLLRPLPAALAVEVALALVHGWVTDPASRTTRFGAPVAGTDLAAGDVIEAYQFEACCPLELALGALTLHVAAHRARIVAAPALRRALDDLPAIGFGYEWERKRAHVLAAFDGVPPPLPRWLLDGRSGEHEQARALGLDGGALVAPSELDLVRP